MKMMTVENSRTGAYYTDMPEDEADAMVAEWNEGEGRNDWRAYPQASCN